MLETISEISQIRELHETITFLNKEVMFSDASAKALIFSLDNTMNRAVHEKVLI